MFSKFFRKETYPPQSSVTPKDLEPRVAVHYGIPSTASILAFDTVQHLLAIGTLDGRIKVIGGDNIEALLISAKPLPFKNLEFLTNQGFLVSVSNENEIQVWDLEHRHLVSSLQWESNITAFSVIYGTHYMYVGDEYGFLSVLKYDAEEGRIEHLPYHIPADLLAEEAGITIPDHHSIVGLLPQPCSSGKRVLIAFENGTIILWDVSEDQAVLVRGYKDLQLKDEKVVDLSSGVRHESSNNTSDEEEAEKEISSLCWVSSDGSILAVGYVDGDILLWNLSIAKLTKDQKTKDTSNAAVKLQLSSGERRLPVIVLHWSENLGHNTWRGQLFVYGGDDIGSEEVLTILSLDWSSGVEALKCVNRVDLTLNGSYADMILVPNSGIAESCHTSALFLLTNPGQLHFYDDVCLSALITQPDRKHSVDAAEYCAAVPTIEPYMTVAKFYFVHKDASLSSVCKETVLAVKPQLSCTTTIENSKWPLTGGIHSQLSLHEENEIRRVYIAGYRDGFVRIWDATFPVLSLMFVLGSQVEGHSIRGASAPISAIDFFSSTSKLAVGNECGLVYLHKLVGNSDKTRLQFVTETKHEAILSHNQNGWQYTAVFSLLNSPVRTLLYIHSGDRLAVGFECSRVAILDVNSPAVLFLTECLVRTSSPVISLAVKTYSESGINDPELSESSSFNESVKEVAFILTKDAHIVAIDSDNGNLISTQLLNSEKESTAISMYTLGENAFVQKESEKNLLTSSQDSEVEKESEQSNAQHGSFSSVDSLILVCCEDSVHLCSSKSVIEGETDFSHKLNLAKPCCWATLFKKEGKESGVILVYQNGVIEIRSFPDLELVGETSLMSILRWNFKSYMNNTMSSSGNGQITMVNGGEFAIISLLAFENDMRIPEALPCLHDKILAAATDASVNFSPNQKKKQSTAPRIFGGIIKGLKGGKGDQDVNTEETREVFVAKLEGMFSRFPFSVSSIDIGDDQEVAAINIDDLEIDEPLPMPMPLPVPVSSLSVKSKNDSKGKETERERLFEGSTTITEPRLRTAEEIKAKYRKTGDASAAASQAKDKLMERGEKLEKLSLHTQELQSGAENFASLANELVKKMENRKWWQI